MTTENQNELWDKFICGYCEEVIPNDLYYIRNNHTGSCKENKMNENQNELENPGTVINYGTKEGELEKKYREEAGNEFVSFYGDSHKNTPFRSHFEQGYVFACQKRQEEIDELKNEVDFQKEVRTAQSEMIKIKISEIKDLKGEIEKYKAAYEILKEANGHILRNPKTAYGFWETINSATKKAEVVLNE